jgi:hypothetical protein
MWRAQYYEAPNTAAAEPEGSTPLKSKNAIKQAPQPVLPTSHPHNLPP